jgi:hypothetical protein
MATGFADQLFEEFAGDCLAQLLRNLAELDWRVSVDSGKESPLLDRVWRRLTEDFRAGGHRVRAEILRLLRDSAYFLPGRVLDLIRFAVRNPAPGGPEEVLLGYFSSTHENVVRAAPELLRRCACSPACLPVCLDLLWELDRGDDRATNTYPDHPFRIITDIAGYQPGKSLLVNWAVAEAARRWLSHPDTWERRHSPLDVLDSLLEKGGVVNEPDSHQIRLRSFLLHYQPVRELREGVLDILDSCLRSGDLRAVLKAVRTLGDGLSGPKPFLNMTFTTDELRQWEPEQLRILGMLGRLIQGNPPPVVSLAVLREVRHQARYGPLESVRERAAALVRSIDHSFDFRLTRMLLPEMSRWDLFVEEAGPDPVAGREDRHRALARSVAAEFWGRFPDPAEAALEIDRRVRELLPVEPKCEATNLAFWLFDARPEAVLPFVRQVLGMPESPVALCLEVGLVHLHHTDPAAFVDFACDALDADVTAFRRCVAHHFAWNVRRETPLHEGEVALIRRLLTDPDVRVRSAAVGALRRVAAFRPREALDLARAVDVGEGPRIAAELCHLADPNWEGCGEVFTDDDVKAILEKIEGVDDLDYDAAQFLKFAYGRAPHAVVEMLIRRIERQERDGYQSGFSPLPFHTMHDTFSGLAGTDRQRELLCRVRDYSLGKKGLPLSLLADLYRDLSGGYGPAGTEVLAEWLLHGNPEKMKTAATLLEEAPSQFVFDHLELVVPTLDRAEASGDEWLRRLSSAFFRIAASGMRSGTPGQPFPQDITLRDQCQEVLRRLPVGGPTYRLFRDLLKEADQNIVRAVQDDEE